jgi:hypothetical protein
MSKKKSKKYPLNKLVDEAIDGEFFTGDGERVMLPLRALVELGLVNRSALVKLYQRLPYGEWLVAAITVAGMRLPDSPTPTIVRARKPADIAKERRRENTLRRHG